MKAAITFFLLLISFCCLAQRPPIPNLPTISLEEAGFNRDSINALNDYIEGYEQNDFRGMVVIKDHKIAIEYFYTNTWRTDINDIRSAGKSITALLLGIAMEDGLVESLEQDVYSFFSKEQHPSLHEDYKNVKLKHLLDMSSGLDADSNDGSTPGNAGQWMEKDDWLDYLLGIPQVNQPGKTWVYADINTALIGAIIEKKCGMSLRDYANEKVFRHLDITKFYWHANSADQTVAAGTLFMSTLDLAKIGVLVANEGRWNNKQIVPRDYISRLIAKKGLDISEHSPNWDRYGMFWYKNQESYNGRAFNYLWASGNGGNHLIVLPSERMVIALTSSAYGYYYGQTRAYTILKKLLKAYEVP